MRAVCVRACVHSVDSTGACVSGAPDGMTEWVKWWVVVVVVVGGDGGGGAVCGGGGGGAGGGAGGGGSAGAVTHVCVCRCTSPECISDRAAPLVCCL